MIVELFLAGALAGLVAGMLGLGGGVILVPVFLALLGLQGVAPVQAMPVAVATSLASIVFTGLSSVLAHHRCGALPSGWLRLTMAAAIGAGVGASAAPILGGVVLKGLFSVFETVVGLRFLLGRPPAGEGRKKGARGRGWMPAALGVGVFSALLGIGGGTLSVPLFTSLGLVMQRAVALSAALGVGIALGGTAGFLVSPEAPADLPLIGWVWWYALVMVVPVSMFTAPVGARLAHRLPGTTLRRVFGGALMGIALAVALA